MGRPKKEIEGEATLSDQFKAGIEVEEQKLKELMDEKRRLREEYEQMLESEKEELKKFKTEAEFNKKQKELRDAGKLVTMCQFLFHYQEEPGGTLSFTKQGIRYELTDNNEYTYLKEITDHINSRTYPDRELRRSGDGRPAELVVVGRIPRCSATILKTFEKEYDEKTDIPDQQKWRERASFSI